MLNLIFKYLLFYLWRFSLVTSTLIIKIRNCLILSPLRSRNINHSGSYFNNCTFNFAIFSLSKLCKHVCSPWLQHGEWYRLLFSLKYISIIYWWIKVDFSYLLRRNYNSLIKKLFYFTKSFHQIRLDILMNREVNARKSCKS